MTPEQATLAADILVRHMPSDPDSMADTLAVIGELRALSVQPCGWRYEAGTLYASNPGDRTLALPRVSGFAKVAGLAMSAPCEWVDATFLLIESESRTADRGTIKAQRHALAKRLEQRHLNALAEAVRSIRLKTRGADVLCVYDPEGIPVRIE